MSEAAREKWDARYGADGYEPNEEPVPFLRERVGDLGSGSALCLAAGTGRNAVFLAAGQTDVSIDVFTFAADHQEGDLNRHLLVGDVQRRSGSRRRDGDR